MIKRADARVRSTRGCSFLTHGGDQYDHRGLNRARRFMDRAVIEEQLQDMSPEVDKAIEDNTPDYRFKVVAWVEDGDKWWLDDWHVVGVFETMEEAQAKVAPWTNEEKGRESYWEMVDVKQDYEAREYLEHQEWIRQRKEAWAHNQSLVS